MDFLQSQNYPVCKNKDHWLKCGEVGCEMKKNRKLFEKKILVAVCLPGARDWNNITDCPIEVKEREVDDNINDNKEIFIALENLGIAIDIVLKEEGEIYAMMSFLEMLEFQRSYPCIRIKKW